MFPKTGTRFPKRPAGPSKAEYISAVQAALLAELGPTHAATKQIMRWTGASDRSARHWLSGTAGPCGHHLLSLARESNAILAAVLDLCGRTELMLVADIHAVEVALAKAQNSVQLLKRRTGLGQAPR